MNLSRVIFGMLILGAFDRHLKDASKYNCSVVRGHAVSLTGIRQTSTEWLSRLAGHRKRNRALRFFRANDESPRSRRLRRLTKVRRGRMGCAVGYDMYRANQSSMGCGRRWNSR